MSRKSGHTKRIAFGGVITALCLAVMFLSGIFPFAEYAIPAIAGMFLVALVVDFGQKTAWICWGAVSLLSLIIVPNKEAALLFVCLFGPYPILKSSLEKLRSRTAEHIGKLAFFNLTVIGSYLLLIYAFGMVEVLDDMVLFGIPMVWNLLLLLGLGNLAFLLYEYVLTGMISTYLQIIRPRLKL